MPSSLLRELIFIRRLNIYIGRQRNSVLKDTGDRRPEADTTNAGTSVISVRHRRE